MNIKWLTDLLNMPLRIIGALAIASGIVLFVPENIAGLLHIIEFKQNYGFYVGALFITTLAILIVTILTFIYRFISNKWKHFRFLRNGKKRLESLNGYQRAIVYLLYSIPNRTHDLRYHDGAINEMVQNLIIGQAANQYITDDFNNIQIPYFLQRWVINYLDNNPEFVSQLRDSYVKDGGQKGLDYLESLQ